MAVDLDNIQGDLWNRGFPKFNEAYYFFTIVEGKEKDFSKALKTLVADKDKLISSLTKSIADWDKVDGVAKNNRDDPAHKKFIVISNALIAFTKAGLDKIQDGLPGRDLGLNNLLLSDPAFDAGMALDGPKNLNDPLPTHWDDLFNGDPIHGLLKVAGSNPSVIESKLNDIKSVLGHPIVINDIDGESAPTSVKSRVDGHVRPWKTKMNGREHFGFRDGISQPLLRGVNSDAVLERDRKAEHYHLETDQNIITVTKEPPGTQDGINADAKKRPGWMIDGSFLAFRKLEQDVRGWIDLVEKFADAGCGSADQCGAKLMGRWKSGAPVTLFPDKDPAEGDPKPHRPTNDFRYKGINKFVCPLGAHIRKVHPRTEADAIKMARMIRNGIPYGTEFDEDPDGKRGLLFVSYQSSLENSFRFVQRSWSNDVSFPTSDTGHDALIGQAKGDELLYTTLNDADDEDLNPGLGKFRRMVTMRGGDYFFVPSISALKDTLGSA